MTEPRTDVVSMVSSCVRLLKKKPSLVLYLSLLRRMNHSTDQLSISFFLSDSALLLFPSLGQSRASERRFAPRHQLRRPEGMSGEELAGDRAPKPKRPNRHEKTDAISLLLFGLQLRFPSHPPGPSLSFPRSPSGDPRAAVRRLSEARVSSLCPRRRSGREEEQRLSLYWEPS